MQLKAIRAGGRYSVAALRDIRIIRPVVGLSGFADHDLGKRWYMGEGRLLQITKTGEVMEIKPDHSFFWIPMQHWLYIKLGLAAVFVYIADRAGWSRV